jgi:hypothetical protein
MEKDNVEVEQMGTGKKLTVAGLALMKLTLAAVILISCLVILVGIGYVAISEILGLG